MGKQVTEMLKGTLEGIVLAILSGRSCPDSRLPGLTTHYSVLLSTGSHYR